MPCRVSSKTLALTQQRPPCSCPNVLSHTSILTGTCPSSPSSIGLLVTNQDTTDCQNLLNLCDVPKVAFQNPMPDYSMKNVKIILSISFFGGEILNSIFFCMPFDNLICQPAKGMQYLSNNLVLGVKYLTLDRIKYGCKFLSELYFKPQSLNLLIRHKNVFMHYYYLTVYLCAFVTDMF